MTETLRKNNSTSFQERTKKRNLCFSIISRDVFLEMIGVASIMPFLAILGDPSLIESSQLLAKIYHCAYKMA